jgi:hypothetical protein
MAVFLLSLMGSRRQGFMGKLYVFAAVVGGDRRTSLRGGGCGERGDRGLLLRPHPEDDDHRHPVRREAGLPAGLADSAWVWILLFANVLPLLVEPDRGLGPASSSLYAGEMRCVP